MQVRVIAAWCQRSGHRKGGRLGTDEVARLLESLGFFGPREQFMDEISARQQLTARG